MKAVDNSVIIKGNNYGIIVVLDPELSFDELKEKVANKFKESSKFFKDAKLAISFEGRKLTNEEQRDILDIIGQNTDMHIVCVIENDPEKEKVFKKTLEQKLMELENNTGQFYKGILRSGTSLEFETSVVIIGDVNNGARVVSKGNIVVLGSLKGTAFAGACGNTDAFVIALDMRPTQIRIADTIARSPDKPMKDAEKEPKIAFLEDGNIYIEPLSKNILNDIRL
ncbi:septum site-determining protein MinC [Herbinix hemicellulosilytica]|uniref:Probable septum site-determining protein MinC n=1 Tax=Herbinix hemicellulosilytica TaxID=1564487 RepID=A0A0H5SFX0_HERHM|nr:septum site-determining protein MinC [Herbinix hemicellulosilytica]RBP60677.1 septum site-determining protein MinC [Herbinix hemicellulosilytica]CRZ34364.1 putative septum site-determining protein MinC [Herbinix hemicellulosilytica]